jgi:hypothetical protein
LAKQQAVTQVNLYVASLNSFGDADPVDTRGRPLPLASITESAGVIFRGSRGGMLRKILNPVLETRCGDVEGINWRV